MRGVRYENEKLKSGVRTDLRQDLSKVNSAQKLAKEYNVGEVTIKNDSNFAKGLDAITKVNPEKRTEILHEKKC